jgi:hypothetical protein
VTMAKVYFYEESKRRVLDNAELADWLRDLEDKTSKRSVSP